MGPGVRPVPPNKILGGSAWIRRRYQLLLTKFWEDPHGSGGKTSSPKDNTGRVQSREVWPVPLKQNTGAREQGLNTSR